MAHFCSNPYRTPSIERHLSELANDGWIIKENFNRNNFDRTSWYTVNGRLVSIALKEWNAEQSDKLSPSDNDQLSESETDKLSKNLNSCADNGSESETDNLCAVGTQIGESELRNINDSPNNIVIDKEYKKRIDEEQINITENFLDLKKTKIRVVKTNEKKLDERSAQLLKTGIDAYVKAYESRYKAKFLDFATLSRSIQQIIKKMGKSFSEQNLIDCINCYMRSQNSWHLTKGHSPIYLAGDIQNIFASTQNKNAIRTQTQSRQSDLSNAIDPVYRKCN